MNNYTFHNPDHIQPLTKLVDLGEQYMLGDQLHEMVTQHTVRDHLRTRHLLGVLASHGTTEDASHKAVVTARTRQHNEELDVFVLRGYQKQPLGLATVDPTVKLRSLRLDVPPILARGRLGRTIPMNGPEVKAWVAPHAGREGHDLLGAAYKVLSDPNGPASTMFARYAKLNPVRPEPAVRAFTIEPLASDSWIHAAIKSAGFQNNGESYYDDGESRRIPVPRSRSYVIPLPAPVA